MARRALLFDFYGPLLTPKQQEIYDIYFQQDLSLGEIAELKQVSRTAIFDLLKRTEEALEEYESKLGLVQRFEKNSETLQKLKARLTDLAEVLPDTEWEYLHRLLKNLEDSW